MTNGRIWIGQSKQRAELGGAEPRRRGTAEALEHGSTEFAERHGSAESRELCGTEECTEHLVEHPGVGSASVFGGSTSNGQTDDPS